MFEVYKNLGKKIKHYRKEKKLTSAQFAKQIGISTGQLSNIENGNYDVFRLELLNSITNSLDISLNDLLQINTIYQPNLLLGETVRSVIFKEEFSDSEENQHLNQQLRNLIDFYLTIASKYKSDPDKIKLITHHLIDELRFIKDLNTSTCESLNHVSDCIL